jgi:hypothetical protein
MQSPLRCVQQRRERDRWRLEGELDREYQHFEVLLMVNLPTL